MPTSLNVKGEEPMVALGREDVLRALKRCQCLAKQDLVLCNYLKDSKYWRDCALARYALYRWLYEQVQTNGVNQTYLLASLRYADLPLFTSNVQERGEREALEVFFQVIEGERPIRAKVKA